MRDPKEQKTCANAPDVTSPRFGLTCSAWNGDAAVEPSAEMAAKMMDHEKTNLLTPRERDRIQAEIHGVPDRLDEDDEGQMNVLIDSLRNCIRRRVEPGGGCCHAYEECLRQDPGFVNNRDFQMMFLRADRYDPDLAARRMVAHLREKLDLFGLDKLTKDLDSSDMDDDDAATLRLNCVSILPFRDRSGRLIGVIRPSNLDGTVTVRSLVSQSIDRPATEVRVLIML